MSHIMQQEPLKIKTTISTIEDCGAVLISTRTAFPPPPPFMEVTRKARQNMIITPDAHMKMQTTTGRQSNALHFTCL